MSEQQQRLLREQWILTDGSETELGCAMGAGAAAVWVIEGVWRSDTELLPCPGQVK